MNDGYTRVTFFASKDGLQVYSGDKLVATIPVHQFGALIYDLAKVMR